MRTEVIIVGGGPAGSAAARCLMAAGADVLVLDKERFPRHKLCAGWITPQVVQAVEPPSDGYPHGFLSFRRLHFHSRFLHFEIPCVQHSIRRFEFDVGGGLFSRWMDWAFTRDTCLRYAQ